jgi:hypothetical protein
MQEQKSPSTKINIAIGGFRYTIGHMDVIRELQKKVKKAGSQKELASALGISSQYLNDLLQGRRNASDNILDKLGLKRVVVKA